MIPLFFIFINSIISACQYVNDHSFYFSRGPFDTSQDDCFVIYQCQFIEFYRSIISSTSIKYADISFSMCLFRNITSLSSELEGMKSFVFDRNCIINPRNYKSGSSMANPNDYWVVHSQADEINFTFNTFSDQQQPHDYDTFCHLNSNFLVITNINFTYTCAGGAIAIRNKNDEKNPGLLIFRSITSYDNAFTKHYNISGRFSDFSVDYFNFDNWAAAQGGHLFYFNTKDSLSISRINVQVPYILGTKQFYIESNINGPPLTVFNLATCISVIFINAQIGESESNICQPTYYMELLHNQFCQTNPVELTPPPKIKISGRQVGEIFGAVIGGIAAGVAIFFLFFFGFKFLFKYLRHKNEVEHPVFELE